MKGIIASVTAALAIAITVAISVPVASANNGYSVEPFQYSYTIGFIHWSCAGTYVVYKHGLARESETCVTSGDAGYFPLGVSAYGPGVWSSDYWNSLGDIGDVLDITLKVDKVANGDGTYTLYVTGTYPK